MIAQLGREPRRTANVVVKVLLWMGDTFANGFVCGKVDGAVNGLRKDRLHGLGITAVYPVPFHGPREKGLNALNGGFPAVPKVINDDGGISSFVQGNRSVGADKTSASGYYDALA